MPTGVFDASLITQRARAKAESNSFINRIQNPTNPTTSYGPLTGIYDNSEVNRVNNGQMKYFQRNGACTVAYIGCPCTVTVNGQFVNNVIGIAPGPVTITGVNYGSIIVTWTPPDIGTPEFRYTLNAYDTSSPNTPIEIDRNINGLQYTIPTPTVKLTPGIAYRFRVFATNDVGTSTTAQPFPSGGAGFYAPFAAPVIDTVDSTTNPNIIYLNMAAYSDFTPTNYELSTYINGSETPVTSTGNYSSNQVTINNLSAENFYSFQVRLYNGTNTSSLTTKTANTNVYPAGPDITSVTVLSSTTVRVNYTNYVSGGGYNLENPASGQPGAATCSVSKGVTTFGYNSLLNTSVIVTGLTPLTTYSSADGTPILISFTKNINSNPINSATSIIPATGTFTTKGIAPVVTSSLAPTANNATITFNDYSSTSGTPGQFDFTGATFSIPGVTIESTPPYPINELYIGSLSPVTQYTNVTMTLTGAGGAISDPSNTFTIVTRSFPVSNLAFSTSTPSTINLTFTKPDNLPGAVVSASVYYDNGVSQFGSVDLISQTELQISGLSESSTFYDVTVVLSDGTYLSGTPSNVVSSISTADPIPPAPQNVQLGTQSYTTQEITFDPYSSPYNLTQAFISGDYGYTNLTQSGLTITGLSPGTYYSGLTFQVGTTGGLSNSANIPDFTTDSLPNPDVTGTSGSYDGFTTTISISYNTYPITPTSGKLFNSNGEQIGSTDNAPTTTALSIADLAAGNYYQNCYIVLYINGSPSPNSNTFYVTTTPVIDAIQNPSYGPNPITITFTVIGASNINGATIYIPGYGNYLGSNITSSSAQFSPSFIGQVSDCYVILSDNGNETLPSNTFTVDTNYPPPQNIGTNIQSDSVTISFTYTAFTPTSGTLYTSNYGSFGGSVSGGSGNYDLFVSGLNPGTDYGESYIQVSDGVGGTSSSSSTFQLTTNP